jgi:3-methyladenine DNA glycosylase AlkD
MDVKTALANLRALGSEAMRTSNARKDAGDNQFGVKLGDIRALAKRIKTDHALGLALWDTGNIDARYLALLILRPKDLSEAEVDRMVRTNSYPPLADWLNSYIVKKHPAKETLRLRWLDDPHPMAARSGWSVTTESVTKSAETLDIPALLDRLEAEMPTAAPEAQWTMNMALAYIGINLPEHRDRALKIGEDLGIYRDFPVSKGCTSPFAPIWIAEMVSRQS